MATTSAPSQASFYLYGITVAGGGATCPAAGVGGAEVETIVEGGLAAVVSRLHGARLRPQRANLAAHHRVLHDLAAAAAGPARRLRHARRSEEQLRRLLRRNHEALARRRWIACAARWRWA